MAPAPAGGVANAILVVLDAAGAGHFGAYGYRRATTPHVDRLAAEGLVFENAYTPAVFTTAAMAAMWTFEPPDRVFGNLARPHRLPRRWPTLAERLTQAGVHTAAWVANANAGRAFGLDRGFREFHEEFADNVGDGLVMAASVARWLGAHPRQPYFAYVHIREPHFPYDPKPPYERLFGAVTALPDHARREQDWIDTVNAHRAAASPAALEDLRRLYDGNLAMADAAVGVLVAALERHGLLDRTTVIVTSDHGEALGEHGFIGHNSQVYDESAHVPLVIRGHLGLAAPQRRTDLVSLRDVGPTILAILGHPDPGRPSVLLGPRAGRALTVTRSAGNPARYAMRDARYSYVADRGRKTRELYERRTDPGERHDLATALPGEVENRAAALNTWLNGVQAGEAGDEPRLSTEQAENIRALGYLR